MGEIRKHATALSLKLGVISELFVLLWEHKLWWLIPIILIMLLFILLIIFAKTTAVVPFIYPLF